MKKPNRPNNGWSSKTKQVARKTVLTAEQRRKAQDRKAAQDRKVKKIGTPEERFKQRELAKAKKLLGEITTVRKSERTVVARSPEKGMFLFG